MPQLYWYIGQNNADYNTLVNWWAGVCAPTNVKLYIGEAAYKAASGADSAWRGQNGINELRTHVAMGRQSQYVGGYCMFNYSSFMDSSSLYSMMKDLNSQWVSAPTLGVNTVPTATEAPAQIPEPDPTAAPAADPTAAPTQAPTQSGSASKFTDMGEYEWAMPYIEELVSQGIVNGISETEFGPDIYISRADATALLYRILKEADISFTENFDDVYKDRYYYDEIGQAKAAGVAWGIGGNLFDPDGTMLRQDMATLAYRVLRGRQILTSIPNTAKALNNYLDWKDIDFYARDAVAACVENNLMGGYGDGTIRPKDFATRIEFALFVQRINTLINAQ